MLAFATGELGLKEVETIELHLDVCDRCRLVVAAALAVASSGDGVGSRAAVDAGDAPVRGDALAATFRPGAAIGGRYVVRRFLARGGMGEVYEVDDRLMAERVALKTVAAPFADDGTAIARLRAEVQVARRVTHPNVCRTFDLGEHRRAHGGVDETILFLTMELLAGESLGQRLRRKGPLSLEAAYLPVLQMAEGLASAHQAGVIHRDFKSDNVMLSPDAASEGGERAVITDFGLARWVHRGLGWTNASSAWAGSVAYMAPEQVVEGRATPSSDVYAFGVVLFETLTGRLPFEGSTPSATATRRLTHDPPSLHRLVPGLHLGIQAFILRCLDRAPERRFPNMHAVVDAWRALNAPAPKIRLMPSANWLLRAAAIVGLGIEALRGAGRPPAAPLPAAASREVGTTGTTRRKCSSVPKPAGDAPVVIGEQERGRGLRCSVKK